MTTPKTLLEAIHDGIAQEAWTGSISSKRVQGHVKDFLSQKFCAAMLRHPEAEGLLEDLFKVITQGAKNENQS